jgi:hypothetical protein
MTTYDEQQAEWHKREDARTVKVGEVRGRMHKDIKKSSEIKISMDHLETLRLLCPVDLKQGDTIRITIDKV